MIKVYDELPNWSFAFDEVSANVYEVVGIDSAGHKVIAIGLKLDELIEQCRQDAEEIMQRVK